MPRTDLLTQLESSPQFMRIDKLLLGEIDGFPILSDDTYSSILCVVSDRVREADASSRPKQVFFLVLSLQIPIFLLLALDGDLIKKATCSITNHDRRSVLKHTKPIPIFCCFCKDKDL
jgi:hypothetical protein